jgi:hypothetical protein
MYALYSDFRVRCEKHCAIIWGLPLFSTTAALTE